MPAMYINDMGQVQVTLHEVLVLRLKHLHSIIDAEPEDISAGQRCGTVTTLSGYTEWVSDEDLPISIGWDWCIQGNASGARWKREDLPRTNIQLLNKQGQALAWEDNLHVLSKWVDAQDWQHTVAQAVDFNVSR